MRQRCTRCVGYLPERTLQAWNKNSRVKLHVHETKLCICSAWFLVHLFPHGTMERCVGDGVIVHCSFGCLFPSLQHVSGQQILQEYLKNVERFFFPKFVVHIHASRKIWFKVLKSMDPEMLAIILFHDFFRERFFFRKGFPFLIVHQFFIIISA